MSTLVETCELALNHVFNEVVYYARYNITFPLFSASIMHIALIMLIILKIGKRYNMMQRKMHIETVYIIQKIQNQIIQNRS